MGAPACPQGWPDPHRFFTVAVEAVQIQPEFQAACRGHQLFVLYSFLPQLCPPHEQCTHSLPLLTDILVYSEAKVRQRFSYAPT